MNTNIKGVALDGTGYANFSFHPPTELKKAVEKPVYLDTEGKQTLDNTGRRAYRQAHNARGQKLYVDADGAETVNQYADAQGTTENDRKMETFTRRVEEVQVGEDGEAVVRYATMSGALNLLDSKRQRFPNALPVNFEEMTEANRELLRAILLEEFALAASRAGIHATTALAEEAGAFD